LYTGSPQKRGQVDIDECEGGMRTQMQRWFLLIAAVVFLAAGCFTITQSFGESVSLATGVLGLFYCWVGNMCIWRHIRDVAGDWDDDEPHASYKR
jgi:hypothetical protein